MSELWGSGAEAGAGAPSESLTARANTNASGPKIEAALATRTAASAIRVAYNE
jgi:hypothetical protein